MHGGLKGVKFCTFLTSFVLALNHCVTVSLSQFISEEKCAFRLLESPLCDNYTCLVFIMLSGNSAGF